MKRLFSKFLLFTYTILITVMFFVVGVPVVDAAGDYYANISSTASGQSLASSLHSLISKHDNIGYDGLLRAYQDTDCKPGTNIIWDMYSNEEFVCGGPKENHNYSKEGDGYNREHSIPQSWFKEAAPMKSDLFHVYPTDGYVNNRRSNYPFGEVGNATWTSKNGSKLGSSSFAGFSGTVFEPIDEYKGDFARTYFYFAICYYDRSITNSNGAQVFKTSYPYLTSYAVSLFTKWHQQDPVSEKEIARNDAVYGYQKNRNPFIDHPEYANTIFGGNYPEEGKYSVTYSIPNGASYSYVDNNKYDEGSKINAPTYNPYLAGYEFVGWYKDVDYQNAWSFTTDKIYSNLTLYAKFERSSDLSSIIYGISQEVRMKLATISSGGTSLEETNETYRFSDHYSGTGTAIQKYEGDLFSIECDKGSNANDPKFYTDAARVYGGGTVTISSQYEITKIVFGYISYSSSNGMSTRTGSISVSDNVGTWTGRANEIVFSIAGTSGHLKISSIQVFVETSSSSVDVREDALLCFRYVIDDDLEELLEEYALEPGFSFIVNDKVVSPSVNFSNEGTVYSIEVPVDDFSEEYTVYGSISLDDEVFEMYELCYSIHSLAEKYLEDYTKEELGSSYGAISAAYRK